MLAEDSYTLSACTHIYIKNSFIKREASSSSQTLEFFSCIHLYLSVGNIFLCTNINVHYINMYTYEDICVYMYISISAYVYITMYAYKYTCIPVYIHMCMHVNSLKKKYHKLQFYKSVLIMLIDKVVFEKYVCYLAI